MTLLKIDYVEFASGDLARSKAFFANAFEWTFQDYGPDYAALTTAGLDGGVQSDPEHANALPLVILKATDLEAAEAAVKAAGGEYLVRGGRHEVLEGDWQPARVAMLRFPSLEGAKAFYDAEMYRAARAKRAGATEFFNMIVVEGVPEPV